MPLIQMDRTLFEAKLIEELKHHPNLYTKRSQLDFHDYNTIEQSWEIVAQKLGSDTKTCKKIWRNLRDSYVRQLKKISCCIETGIEPGQFTKWKHFDKMSFLKNVISHRSANENKSIDQNSSVNGKSYKLEMNDFVEQNSISSDPISDKDIYPNDNKSTIDDETNGELTTNSFLTRSSTTSGIFSTLRAITSEEAFGNHVAKSLENLSAVRRSVAKVKIQEILSEFEQEDARDPVQFIPNIFLNSFK